MTDVVTALDSALELLVRQVLTRAEPELILLFGSRAWGVPREDSDYDVMLVLRTPDMVKLARDAASDALRSAGFSVDVLACTVEEYERRQHDPGLVSYKIAREGRVLYSTGRVMQYTAPTAQVREHPPREGVEMWLDRAETDFQVAERSFALEEPEWAISRVGEASCHASGGDPRCAGTVGRLQGAGGPLSASSLPGRGPRTYGRRGKSRDDGGTADS